MGQIFGRSKNVPKSIAICPGVKISHFGIIKYPPRINTLKTKKTKISLDLFAVFWALSGPVLGLDAKLDRSVMT